MKINKNIMIFNCLNLFKKMKIVLLRINRSLLQDKDNRKNILTNLKKKNKKS